MFIGILDEISPTTTQPTDTTLFHFTLRWRFQIVVDFHLQKLGEDEVAILTTLFENCLKKAATIRKPHSVIT